VVVERLARREPRLLARLRSRDAGDRLVARALAGGTRPAAPKPRADSHAITPQDALLAEVVARWQEIEGHSARGTQITALLRDRRARRQILVEAGDDAMVHLWSWQRPEARFAVREAIDALAEVLSASRYRGAASVSVREAFWQFLWSERDGEVRRGEELLARFLEQPGHEQPKMLALLRASTAGAALVARVLARSPGKEVGGARGWLVRTAGVVLLWSLLQRYFERLGLVERDAFRDLASHERACGLIRYLASGQTELASPS
jgi:hypothetical protein